MTTRNVFITGNCQVRPVADALRMIFPDDLIIDITSWDFADEENTVAAMKYLRSLDVQIRMPDLQTPLSREDIGFAPDQLVLEIPSITFPAFHPDMVYAEDPNGDIFRGLTDYHSGVGLWAWCHGLSVAEAAQLFSDDALSDLGYDDYWDVSVSSLREAFDSSDLEFGPFWSSLQRTGLFMHTINHPNPAGIAALAKAVAAQLGAAPSVWNYPLERYLTDYCSSSVWPVYPSIGRRLGIPGTWHWRLHERQILSAEEWVSLSYEAYGTTDPNSIKAERFMDGSFDRALQPRVPQLRIGAV